ncbi:MAG: flavin reductase family protein [Pseudomonadales bacterium]
MDPNILQLTALMILLIAMTQAFIWAYRLIHLRKGVMDNRQQAFSGFNQQLKRIQSRVDFRPTQRAWSGERPFKIASKTRLNRTTCSLTLVPDDGGDVAGFAPGQHVFLSYQAPGKQRTVRCYSILNGAHLKDHYRIAVRRLPGEDSAEDQKHKVKMSTYLHDDVRVGQNVQLKAPGGHFFLNPNPEDQTPIVLVGLDIGVIAVMSIADTLIAQQEKRPICLAYFARNEAETMLLEEMHALRVASGNTLDLRICIGSHPRQASNDEEYQFGDSELSELTQLATHKKGADFYVAGYTSAVNQSCEHLLDSGVPYYALRSELYKINRGEDRRQEQRRQSSGRTPRVAVKPKAKAQTRTLPKVRFANSDRLEKWIPTFGSLLEFAEAQNIDMPSDCRMGSCHTCMTRVKTGSVEYTQAPFNEPDEGHCLPCICVPANDIELEI